MILPPLRRKALRDLRRLWAQALAIALVLASGIATLILGTGAYDALSGTRAQFYAENRFADVFASLTRAPVALVGDIAALDGVLVAEGRIRQLALLDLDDMAEPGSVSLVSLPEGTGAAALNRLHLRLGRLPDPQAANEAVVSESFAKAHRLRPGSSLRVLMNGRQRRLQVVGVAISPEFIYALGPGQAMPDPLRYGVVWLPRDVLEAAYDLTGAFNDLTLQLAPGADAAAVIAQVDARLAPYGGVGAVTRKDQLSNAFLDAELSQLRAMSRVLPPVFLAVAALLVNMVLSRLVALEREQIGLLKAIGYGPAAIAGHYLEFVTLIALLGIAIGSVAGTWLGYGMAQLYSRFFSFPYLVFSRNPSVYGVAALITLAAALGGALWSVRGVMRLAPAVAMQPPAPPDFRRRLGAGLTRYLARTRQTSRMVLRHLTRWPWRTGSSVLGVAMAVSVLVASLWTQGSFDRIIAITFYQAQLQDATLAFAQARPARAARDIADRLPGVLLAEPFRSVAVEIRKGPAHRKLALTGKPEAPRLARTLSPGLQPMTLPGDGLILSEALADALDARPGDHVTVVLQEGRRQALRLPVRGISLGYLGLSAEMELGALNRLIGEGAAISGVNLRLDPALRPAFDAAIKATPGAGFVVHKADSLTKFRETLQTNVVIIITVYTVLALIIGGGVVYNFARIALSEQGRELASLRVLGFTAREVAAILFAELAAVVLLAQPLGWLIGYGIARGMVASFSSDLYRMPFVMGREVYATASLVVLGAALASALLIWGRIRDLDMIAVLKTRE